MIAFEDVSWTAGGRPILDRIELVVAPGELVVLIGPSGVGKSSLLRLAAGLIVPDAGVVRNTAARTAMVFQDPRLLPWESALDNVGLPLERFGASRRRAREEAERALSRLGFTAAEMALRPRRLSGGMKARVAVARAFVVKPDLVLLDEPFAALDLGLRRDLQAEVRTLVEESGTCALFVTHDLTEAVRLADRIAVLAGRPARIDAEIGRRPLEDQAEIWRAAAELTGRPEIAAVMRGLTAPTALAV